MVINNSVFFLNNLFILKMENKRKKIKKQTYQHGINPFFTRQNKRKYLVLFISQSFKIDIKILKL